MAQRQDQRRVLIIVLLINASLFIVELGAGLSARSTALLGDSLDMLGDSLVYGFSLYVLTRSARSRIYAALVKGAIMTGFASLVFAEAMQKMLNPVLPGAATMGVVSLVALGGNLVCFWLLYRHRTSDLNMRSTWLCSRNDLIANVSVMGAAIAVAMTRSAWPDVAVGITIAVLFVATAFGVIRDAVAELRTLRFAGQRP